jgi:lipoprotein-releasing system permease protein
MSFEFFIARRYLRTKRKLQFVSTINRISVIGITVGVAALLIILSVFNGFTGVVKSILISFDPHLRIEKQGAMDAEEYAVVKTILQTNGSVRGFSPFISGKAMVVTSNFSKVVYIKGIDEQTVGEASGLKEKVVLGNLSLRDSAEIGSAVIGLTLADRLSAVVGDEFMIVSPYVISSVTTPFAQLAPAKFIVRGIFESNNKDYDASYAYVSLESAQRLFRMEGLVSGVEVRLTSLELAGDVQSKLSKQLPSGIRVLSWYDLHQDLYSVMQIERWVAYILVSLVILVASFNMLGSLTMSVIEKQRDIGVLKSMGATTPSIVRIFMFDGILVGFVGTVLGIALGLTVVYLQDAYHLFPLDPTVYIIPAIPVEIHIEDFITVSLASLLLSTMASYYPARRAARVVPVEAIRWE